MAWNEPGGSGNGNGRDPWGNRGKDQGPPDLDEVIRNLRNSIGGLFGGGGGSSDEESSGRGGMGLLIVLALVAWFAIDASYIIDQKQRGVVLRFGQYVETLQPGFNMRLPRPFEKVLRVDVDSIRSISIGTNHDESYMLTHDENIVDVRFEVQYRIKDPKDFVFNDSAPSDSLRVATESAVREIVGQNDMDFVIKDGRTEVSDRARDLVQKIVDNYQTGIEITSFNMQQAKEPEQVRAAFADAVKAQADAERYKNEAQAYQNEVVGKAQGAAQRTLLEAQGYRSRVVESAKGDASRFTQLLGEYEKAPEVTRERLYIEAIESVLSNSTKIMTDTKGGGNNLLYLPLDQIMKNTQRNKSTGGDIWSPDYVQPGSESSPIGNAGTTDTRNRGRR
ncbi:MAG: FtsH protease activity modulator HflK [Sulfuriflexus sp.]|nr:FtsH protease activity modulator HflK [Sulfuriflexus sp.]